MSNFANGAVSKLRAGDAAVTLTLAIVLAFLLYLGPELLSARELPGVDTNPRVSGLPVAASGIYFFTILALVVAGFTARGRGSTVLQSVILAVAGLGFFEAVYGVSFAATTGRLQLLVPSAGLPVAGWAGLGTWVLVESLVASFALISWERAGLDRVAGATLAVFVIGLVVWDVVLGWHYPPYDNSAAVYVVNTVTEVSGTTILPVVFTVKPVQGPDFLRRAFARWRQLLVHHN